MKLQEGRYWTPTTALVKRKNKLKEFDLIYSLTYKQSKAYIKCIIWMSYLYIWYLPILGGSVNISGAYYLLLRCRKLSSDIVGDQLWRGGTIWYLQSPIYHCHCRLTVGNILQSFKRRFTNNMPSFTITENAPNRTLLVESAYQLSHLRHY